MRKEKGKKEIGRREPSKGEKGMEYCLHFNLCASKCNLYNLYKVLEYVCSVVIAYIVLYNSFMQRKPTS